MRSKTVGNKFRKYVMMAAFFMGALGVRAAAPTIQPLTNQTVYVDHPVLVELWVSDAETPTNLLDLKLTTSNPSLVDTNKNVVFHWFADGGPSFMPRWYATIAPTFGQTGTTTNTVIVSDGTSSASTTFVLTVVPPPANAARFVNPNPISFPTNGAASPYPSTNVVTGMTGTMTNIVVTFSGFWHQNPNDLHMLLVSPSGQGMVIWSKVGGGGSFGGVPPDHAVTNVTATLTDAAPDFAPLPDFYYLWSEQFRPADYAAGNPPTNNFPSPAPAGPYAPTLVSNAFNNAFNGLSPNGTWSLYIYDDQGPYAGGVLGGWSLIVMTTGSQPPTITDIADQATPQNTPTAALPFTINDVDTPVGNLILSRASSNPTLVPTNNIVFGGSGSNRTVTVTPANGLSGTSLITITVSDGTNSASDSFLLTVGAVGNPPTIASIPNKTTLIGRAVGPFNITIGDVETPVGNLILTGSSSNTNLVPNANIIFFNGGVTTLTVQPVDGLTGSATITVNVSDGTNTTGTSFTLTVNAPGAGAGIFNAASAVSLPLTNVASVYPSTNVVSGLTGTITNLTLTLKGLTHSAPHDLEMLLVSPGGQSSVFFSHVGGGSATNVTVTVDDSATYQLPPSPFAILTGTYRSADFSHGTFPAPAPVGPYGTDLTPFLGATPSGNWLLYIFNDPTGTGSGTLAQGWSLYIATDASNSPPTAANMAFGIPEDTTTNLVLVGSDTGGAVTFATLQTPTNGVLLNLNTNTGAVTYRPNTNYFGPDFFTYRVSDGSQFATGTVSVTVSPVNDAPAAASFSVTLPEDGTTNLTLLGSDVESAVTYGTVSSPAHGTLSNFNTNTGAITYKPATNYFGLDSFSYRVSDGSLLATGAVSITVSPVDDPAVADNQSITMPKDTVTNLVLTATDVDTANTVSDVMAATGAAVPDNWTLTAGATKVAAVAANDGDTSYLLSGVVANAQQQFTLADPAHIQPGDVINSVTLRATCRRNGTPSGSIQLIAVLGANTSSGAAQGTANGYADFSETFTSRPGGGAWTLADVRNLEIRIQNTQTRDVGCTRLDAAVSFIGNTNRLYAILAAPANGTLSAFNPNNGGVTYTPNSGYAGTDSFTFTVNAGGVLSTGLVSIVLTGTSGTSGPVVANPIGTQLGGYGTNFSFTFPTNTFTDSDTPVLTYSAAGMPPGVSFTGGTRTFAGVPTASGSNVVALVATDDSAPPKSATNSFLILVAKRALTVIAASTNKVYGSVRNFTGSEFSLTNGTLFGGDTLTNAALTSTGSPTNAVVGGYPIIPSNAAGMGVINYSLTYSNGTLNVVKAALVAAATNQSRAFGQSNPVFTINYSGFVNGEGTNVLDARPVAGTAATNTSPPGPYPITLNGGTDNNYAFSLVNGTLTVTPPGPLVISSVALLNPSQVRLTGTGDAGVAYRVEKSSDLVSWQNLGAAPANGGGAFEFIDSTAGASPLRFYRVLYP